MRTRFSNLELNWNQRLGHNETKLNICHHMLVSRVHTTAKQVISRRRKIENVFKLSKDEKCACKACKNTVFHCQICKFVGFLLPSSSSRGCLSSLGDKIEVANFLQPNSSLFLIFGSKPLCFVEDYCCGLYEDYNFPHPFNQIVYSWFCCCPR